MRERFAVDFQVRRAGSVGGAFLGPGVELTLLQSDNG